MAQPSKNCFTPVGVALLYALGVALLFASWFLALAPHAYRGQAGLKEQSHEEHVLEGIVLVVAGLGALTYYNSCSNNVAEKKKSNKNSGRVNK